MFAHHIGDDWILVVIIQRWGRVLYFYSQRSRRENHTDLKAVLDEAFETYRTAYKISRMPSARPGFECGFYTARHMEVALGLLEVRKLEDFDVMVNPLGEDMLKNI